MPLPKPKKGESQNDFIGRCMAEAYGDDAPADRTQEQAVAMCMQAWRDRNKKEAGMRIKQSAGPEDCPEPDTEESESEYIDRCIEDLSNQLYEGEPNDDEMNDIENACEMKWDEFERSYKLNKSPEVSRNKKEGVMGRSKKTKEERRREVERIIARMKAKFGDITGVKNKDIFDDIDFPEPDVGENKDDYMDRCVQEVIDGSEASDNYNDSEIEEGCDATANAFDWDDNDERVEDSFDPKKKSVISETVFKAHSGKVSGMTFILSDETPDRLGDIILSDGWKLTSFNKNPIALFNHKSDFPIGKWHDLGVKNKQLIGDLEFAPYGTSERIDEIRKLVEAGILKAVSVGFKPLKHEPLDPEKPFSGSKFLECELVETSLVSVPANPNALAVVKSLGISEETRKLVFAGQGNESSETRRRGYSGGKARTAIQRRRGMTPLGTRITEAQAGLQQLRDKLLEHLRNVDDSNVSDAQLETTTELNAQIAQREKQLNALKEAEKNVATKIDNGGGNNLTTVLHDQRSNGNGQPQRPFAMAKQKTTPIEYIVRAGTVMMFAHQLKKSTEEVRQQIARVYGYYDDDATRFFVDYAAKAASAPAMTTVAGWAAELVEQINADIMQTLMPKSVYPRLAGLGLSLSFGRAGRIVVPRRQTTPTIAGSFVGEGQPIPVRQGAFTSQTLTPKKMAVITTWTREMDEHSIPAIEGLLRDAIREDTAVSLDSVLLDNGAATTVRPAGILNGVSALTPTAGGGFNAIVGDIKQLTGAILTATNGNIRNMAWLMNPQQVLSLGLTTAPSTGAFPFKDEVSSGRLMTYPIIDSGTVPLGTVIVIDAADFCSVGGEAPRFEISDQATLHMEDTTPAQIVGGTSPGTPAFPTRSLWQTDTLALRLILPINWTLRRTGIVAWVQGVTW